MLSMNKTDGLSNARLSRDVPVKRNSRVENENLFHGRGRVLPPRIQWVGRKQVLLSWKLVGLKSLRLATGEEL